MCRSAAAPTTALTTDASLEAHRLVARFLRHLGYTSTLTSLLVESTNNHPLLQSHLDRTTAPSAEPHAHDTGEDLQDVVDEWLASRLARLKVNDTAATLREQLDQLEYTEGEGEGAKVGPARTAWRETSNVLTVTSAVVPRREWDSSELRFRTCVPLLLSLELDLCDTELTPHALLPAARTSPASSRPPSTVRSRSTRPPRSSSSTRTRSPRPPCRSHSTQCTSTGGSSCARRWRAACS